MNSQIRLSFRAPGSYEIILREKINYWCRKQIEYTIWYSPYPNNLVRIMSQKNSKMIFQL